MKLFLIVACLLAATIAAPTTLDSEIVQLRLRPALEHEEIHDEFGQYALRYVTAEGIVVSERGYLVPTPTGAYVMVVEGETRYIGDDGQLYVTKYSAGLNGTKVEGNHLPVPVKPIELVVPETVEEIKLP